MNSEMTMSRTTQGKGLLVTGAELGAATAKAPAEQGATFDSFSKPLYRDRSSTMRSLEAPGADGGPIVKRLS
jgi:hypothetical protein